MMQWYPVRAYLPAVYPGTAWEISAEIYEDEIQGRDPSHALARARWNWPKAERVELIECKLLRAEILRPKREGIL